VLRTLGFLIAAVLGVIGVWYIVVGNSSKDVRIGVIAAFWGLLLGTFAVFGSRVPGGSEDPAPAPAPEPSRELDIRQIGEIERSAVAAARREFQQELQIMLRREVHDGFAREVASLRAEVNALRSDLVEKVGGQLRLERIETTRLIGSDLEAVQSELRKLRETAVDGDDPGPALPPVIPVAATRTEVHDAEIVAEVVSEVVSEDSQPVEPVDHSEPEPAPPVHEEPPARTNGAASSDPFASMPRIRPFTDFELDPVPSAPADDPGRHSRRHRADDGGSDVLAKILAREQR
jgi:hypothetical protein